MPRQVEFEGKIHQFPDDATDDEIRSALEGGFFSQAADAGVGVLRGAGKGLWSTSLGLSKLLGRVPKEATLEDLGIGSPSGVAENIGYGGERIAEFMLPGGALAKGGKLIQGLTSASRLSPVGQSALNLLGRGALEGVSAGAISEAQTGGASGFGKEAALSAIPTMAIGAAAPGISRISQALRTSAGKSVQQALRPTTKPLKGLTEKITPGILSRKVRAISLPSLSRKIAANLEDASANLDEALKEVSNESRLSISRRQVGTSPIFEERVVDIIPGAHPAAWAEKKGPALGSAAGGRLATEIAQNPTVPHQIFEPDPRKFPFLPQVLQEPLLIKRVVQVGENPVLKDFAFLLPLSVRTKPIVQAMERYKTAFEQPDLGFVVDPSAVRMIEGIQETVAKWGDQVSFDSLRQLRIKLDDFVTKGGKVFGRTVEEGSKVDVTKTLANAIRHELAQAAPSVAKMNAEFSFWKNFETIVDETITRTSSQSTRLGERLAGAAGMAGGLATGSMAKGVGFAVALGAIKRFTNSPAWKLTSAVEKNRMADILAHANPLEMGALVGRLNASVGAYATAESLRSMSTDAQATFEQLASDPAKAEGMMEAARSVDPAVASMASRSFLQGLIEKPPGEPGVKPMQAILDRWRGLPGSLKEKVFKNDNLRKDVGNFFNLVESMRESPTFGQKRPATASMLPSGMLRLVNPLDGTAYKVGAAGLTKILFNPKGARALMEGLAIQGKTAGRTLAVAEVLKIAGDDVQKIEPGDEPQGVR